MKRALITFLLISILIFTGIKSVYAFDLSRPNNKFGIHLAQPHLSDLKKTAEMVNANGGDWGYVTLVIQDDDRNRQKWQEIFDLLREEHLIPIIRIATHPEGANWKRPVKEDAQSWVDFLDSLHWVIKNRYVILFNEPNHGTEWGGTVDAEDYAKVSLVFAQKLKTKNSDFFIILAGLDASAPSSLPVYESEENFLRQIVDSSIKNIFDYIDGLSSHSYPNPGFSGSPWNSGRGTVQTYDWELNLLKSLGVQKNLPVFITETGWSASRLSRETVASYLQNAYQNVWLPDNKVVAVTPFVFDYQGDPFLNFSWKLPSAEATEEQAFYPQYYTIQSLSKSAGDPEQIDTGSLAIDFPKEFVASSNYHLRLKLKNTGQAIWDKKDNYELRITGNGAKKITYFFSDLKQIKPFEETEVDLYLKTISVSGRNTSKVVLVKKDKNILETGELNFEIIPLPSLKFKVKFYPKLITEGDQFEIQVFDEKEELVFKRGGLQVKNGIGYINDVQNVIPGRKYRIVVLNPYYLPRQISIIMKRADNTVQFKRMIPFDFNRDGHLDWEDLNALFQHPELMRLLFP